MGIITKGMGKILKSKMRKAFVDKPTFPGPNTINILNRELKKKITQRGPSVGGYRKQDIVEGAVRMRKGKPGKSFIDIDARVKRAALRDRAKGAKMPKEYKKVK
jgi:hypothetical protein